jgi:imidazolonepropionase
MIRVITHASELITGSGIEKKGGRRIVEEDLGAIPDGAIVYRAEKRGKLEVPREILWVGATSELPKRYIKERKRTLRGERALIPGYVDCHTHLVFAGDRSEEFAQRCGGMSYEEIARRGGGIIKTVSSTRAATENDLFQLAAERLQELASFGVRTVEIKSGYGLSHHDELKILRVARKLQKKFPQYEFQITYLGAHAFPKELSRTEYMDSILNETLPEVKRGGLADACDVFIDEGYFTIAEGRLILEKAKNLKMKTKIHADELACTNAAVLASEVQALSADHLLKISTEGVLALAKSNTVAVLLPGTAFYLKASQAPARELLEAGACVALSTDFNPGTSMMLNLPAVMTIAALYLGMTRAEIFSAVTFNAAKALGYESRIGTLTPGKRALFQVLPFRTFEESYYRFAWNPHSGK